MEAQAEEHGLTFDFIAATDGRGLTAEQRGLVDHDRRRSVSKYPLTDNEIACWISHRRTMQAFLESGAEMATILEDDAKILQGFSDVLRAVEQSGKPFDVLDLHRFYKRGEKFRASGPLTPDFEIGRIGLMHMLMAGYIITRSGAEKFLAYSTRFTYVIDKEFHRYWANGLDIYGLNRHVVYADDGGVSYIEETRKNNNREELATLPNSDTLAAMIRRKAHLYSDSLIKRLVFPAYVRAGKAVWSG